MIKIIIIFNKMPLKGIEKEIYGLGVKRNRKTSLIIFKEASGASCRANIFKPRSAIKNIAIPQAIAIFLSLIFIRNLFIFLKPGFAADTGIGRRTGD